MGNVLTSPSSGDELSLDEEVIPNPEALRVAKLMKKRGIDIIPKSFTGDDGKPVVLGVPKKEDREKLKEEYTKLKRIVAQKLDGIESLGVGPRKPWEWTQTSKSVDELLELAEASKSEFMETIHESLGGIPGTEAYFGKDDQFVTKSKGSLERKVEDVTQMNMGTGLTETEARERAVCTTNDSLRGTVLVDTIDNLRPTVENMVRLFESKGGEVSVSNKWNEDYPDGYVGIHLVIKFAPESQPENFILAELQIHLKAMKMGKIDKLAHTAYESTRGQDSTTDLGREHIADGNIATQALLLSVLDEIVDSG